MKRILSYILILVSVAASLMAQTSGEMVITTLDWNVMKIDSLLPVYDEVIPLESDYTLYDYNVTIDYPEYAELTREETEKASAFDSKIGENINVDSYVGVSRREGMLDISFVPIIKRNGKYLKLLSAQITIHNTPKKHVRAATSKAGRYAENSKLREGAWVKISVTEEGMYRLSRKTLTSMGFTNPEKVHLYGYGAHLQNEVINAATDYDDLEEVPLYYSSATDSWLFWGNGLVYWNGDIRIRNHYANYGCYFLRQEEKASGIETVPSSNGTVRPENVYNSYRAHVLHEKEEFSWHTAGRNLVEEHNFKDGAKTYTLNTPDAASTNFSVNIASTVYRTLATSVTPVINGKSYTPMAFEECSQYTYADSVSMTYNITDTQKSAVWNIKMPQTTDIDSHLDYIAINYDRKLKPLNGAVAFSKKGTDTSEFNIEGSGLVVMRTSEPKSPAQLIKGKQDGSKYTIVVDNPSRNYVAFNPAFAFPEPTFVERVANQNLHATPACDMVIILPKNATYDFQAKRLAQAHEMYDGLKTVIVHANQIYNEFSSGTPDATAYRRFLKMLYDRAEDVSTAPKYLILMGDCAWDNRMLCQQWKYNNPDNYLLCFSSEESFSDTKSYVMEDYFGLLDDGEGGNLLRDKTDLGVGRFPVTSNKEAMDMVTKTIRYITMENADSWKNHIYMLGDDGDENQHMEYCNEVANNVRKNNPEMEVHKIMWDNYKMVKTARSNTYPEVESIIKDAMSNGALIMNYTGHSATFGLSHEYVLENNDFKETKGTNLPLWITCSCDAMPFDGVAENLGEVAMRNAGGAAMAFYGTSRTVYATQNKRMNNFFMEHLLGTDSKGARNRLGDAIRLAKSDIISSGAESNYKENKIHYALLGDPALTIGAPLQRVVLDSINGKKVNKNDIQNFKAGEKMTLKGHVEDASGNKMTNFKGKLTTRMYDNEELVVCKNNAKAKNAFEYTDRVNVLYQSQDSVSAGEFALSLVVPIDINYSDQTGRFVFYAINEDKSIEANGYNENFTIGGIVEDMTYDTEGPKIYAYLNDEDFENGGVVCSTPFFYASIEDESGINANGNGIGHDLILTVDGKTDRTYNLNPYYIWEFGDYTKGAVAFTIPELEDGPHSLTFRAWDILNHSNTAKLSFIVDHAKDPGFLKLTATRNPAETETSFVIRYNLKGADCTFKIEIFDFMGQCVWGHTEHGSSTTGVYTIPYNLCNGSGSKLSSGIYLYRATVQSGTSKETSKTEKLIIKNNK